YGAYGEVHGNRVKGDMEPERYGQPRGPSPSELGAGSGPITVNMLGLGLEEHLPFLVTGTLVRVLRDPLLSAHYQAAVQLAVDICSVVGEPGPSYRHSYHRLSGLATIKGGAG
ncbi:unnamed protein product, partial [Discosporangium mesarthrocarpum]